MAAALRRALAVVAVIAAAVLRIPAPCSASDPQLTVDFFLPAGVNASDAYFTFTGLRNGPEAPAGTFAAIPVFSSAFPALTGLGISAALFEYQPGSQNPPHTHPRGSELLYVLQGPLDVGFVDTAGDLFAQTLQTGDLFVFPVGLVHWQINPASATKPALALASFSSSNPGLVSLPTTLFATNISADVLTGAFHLSPGTLAHIEATFKSS